MYGPESNLERLAFLGFPATRTQYLRTFQPAFIRVYFSRVFSVEVLYSLGAGTTL